MAEVDENQTGSGEPASGQEPPASTRTDGDSSNAIKKLRDEAARYRVELREAQAELKKHADAGKTAQERLEGRASAAESRAAELERDVLRYAVAAEKGLPLSQAKRLIGSTKDELEADADQFIKEIGLSTTGATTAGGSGFDGGVRRPVQRPKSMNGLIRQAAGR